MPKPVTRQEAVRLAKKQLVETLAAKQRLEMRLNDLRQDGAKWRERESLANKAGESALQASAADRAMKIEAVVVSTRRDLESLDVDIVRLRHDVHAAQSPSIVPAFVPDDVARPSTGGQPSTANSSREPNWESLLQADVDQEIAAMRQRIASPRTDNQPGATKEK